MLTITRKVTRTDIDGVLALIGLLSDAKGCAARLSELTAAAEQADAAEQKAVAAQKAAHAEAQATQSAGDDLMEKAQGRLDAADRAEAAVVEGREGLLAKAAELAERGDKLAAWTNDLDSRDAAAKLRGEALDAREAKLIAAEEAAAKLRDVYAEKMEKLRSLTGA
jgi:hypothetical protein